MRNLLTIVILAAILSFSAAADLSTNVAALSKEIAGTELPGAIGALFGSEKINIHIQQDSGVEFVAGLVTKDKKVASLAEGAVAEPSLNVYTTEEAILEIQQAQDPGKALINAFKYDKITYKGVGFGNKVKFAFTSLFAKVAGLFSPGNEDKNEDKTADTSENKTEEKQDKTDEKSEEKAQKTEEKAVEKDGKEPSKEEPKNITLENVHKTYIVLLENNGFNPAVLNIKVGDSIEWKVSRSGQFTQGMILGTQNCVDVKSGFLKNGELYKWTFTEAETCIIVDGIITTQASTVVVE